MRSKILAIALVLLSPIVYYYLTMLFIMHVSFPIIHAFTIKSLTPLAIVFILVNTICAIITAFVTVLPCSYLLGANPKYIIALFLITILSFPIATFFMQSDFNKLTSIVFVGQCVAVSISVYYFANVGYRRAAQKKRGAVGGHTL